MTNLTAAQRTMLADAARAEDAVIQPSAAGKTTALSLNTRGLLAVTKDANRLAITEAGRSAIEPPGEHEPAAPGADATGRTLSAEPKGKIAILLGLLRGGEGATIKTMMAATGWQAHSIRGAISGAIKKTLGLNVISEKTDAGRTYRIVQDGAA